MCRFWHLVETSIDDCILAPLSKEWISNMNAMVPPHLLKLKEAYKNFLKVIITLQIAATSMLCSWNGLHRQFLTTVSFAGSWWGVQEIYKERNVRLCIAGRKRTKEVGCSNVPKGILIYSQNQKQLQSFSLQIIYLIYQYIWSNFTQSSLMYFFIL